MTELFKGDCLEVMKTLPDKSFDLILCDLPYGITTCKWDSIIPFEQLWEEYKRLIKDNCAIVLFSQQPFTSLLITSNLPMWKYNWVWEKDNATNFLNANYQPMRITEDICVFGNGAISFTPSGNCLKYYPQYDSGKPYSQMSGSRGQDSAIIRKGTNENGYFTENNGIRYPKNLLKVKRDKDKVHPTQKPVSLLEYLIKTYTKENEKVLDNCMGSGSTGVACKQIGRDFIGIEKDSVYFNLAKKRIDKAVRQGELFV